jgi:molecular chaperone DnaK
MVKDAEAHADDDRKFHEVVAARNQADTMIHATRKSIEQLGDDKLEAGEKDSIESAIKDLEDAMKGEDKDRIESLTKVLSDASGKMAERLYAQAQGGDAGGAGAAGASAGGAAGAESGATDDVVDAEFEEVKDDKK